jgi:hypothetical protein
MDGSTKSAPWITVNGVDVSDSQLCIQYLKELLGIRGKMDAGQKATAHAFRKEYTPFKVAFASLFAFGLSATLTTKPL